MARKRRRHTATDKLRVALTALEGSNEITAIPELLERRHLSPVDHPFRSMIWRRTDRARALHARRLKWQKGSAMEWEPRRQK